MVAATVTASANCGCTRRIAGASGRAGAPGGGGEVDEGRAVAMLDVGTRVSTTVARAPFHSGVPMHSRSADAVTAQVSERLAETLVYFLVSSGTRVNAERKSESCAPLPSSGCCQVPALPSWPPG